MSAGPVQISIERVDKDPHTKREGRSAFARDAIQLYLKAKHRRSFDARLARAFYGKAEDLQEDVAAMDDGRAGMARRIGRDEIWMFRFGAPDKRRPVLVLSRQVLLDMLHTATIVPITRSLHGPPTEVELGVGDGLDAPSCANRANVQTTRQQDLQRFVGRLRPRKMADVCLALAIATGCD